MSTIHFRALSVIGIFVFVLSLVHVQAAPVLAQKQGCMPAPSDMVAWWPGDSVTAANDIVGKSHGDMLGGASLVPGLVGDSFGFDGVDDLVVIPYTDAISTPGPFSLEFWFSPATTISPSDTLSHVFWSKGFNNSIDTANSQGIIEVRGPVPRPITTTDTWAGGSWNHVALTYDGAQYVLYINGSQQVEWVQDAGVRRRMLVTGR